MEEKEQIEKALIKVALGFQLSEVTEEYAEVDGELKLTKRKKTKKDVPPDLKAVQMLLCEGNTDGYQAMSDEELEKERQRLIDELFAQEKGEKKTQEKGQVCVEMQKTVKKPRAKPRKRVVRK